MHMVKQGLARIILLIMTCALLFASGCSNSKDNAGGNTTGQPQVSANKSETPTGSTTSPQVNVSPASDEPTDVPDDPDKPTGDVSSGERIGFITQEYDGDNIAEIPYLEYDGDMNSEIESINRLFNQGYQFRYEKFLTDKLEHEWIEIKSYPFTTDKYLQIVITSCVYPNYGTDGDLESVNYDRYAKKWLTIEDALNMMGLNEDEVSAGVGESYDPEIYGGLIAELKIAGFLIHDTPNGERVELLLSITVENQDAELWQGFYSYMPDGNDLTNDLTQLDGYCLFDPYNMDQMDPPLAYQQES